MVLKKYYKKCPTLNFEGSYMSLFKQFIPKKVTLAVIIAMSGSTSVFAEKHRVQTIM